MKIFVKLLAVLVMVFAICSIAFADGETRLTSSGRLSNANGKAQYLEDDDSDTTSTEETSSSSTSTRPTGTGTRPSTSVSTSTPSRPTTGSTASRPSASTTKTISEIKMTINAPKYGEKLDWAPVMVTPGIKYDHMYWDGHNLTTAGQWAGVNENETAIATQYKATIFFTVEEGYVLDSNLKTGTVNDASGLELVSLNYSPHGIKTQEFNVVQPTESVTIEGFNFKVSNVVVGEALPSKLTFKPIGLPEEEIAIPTNNNLTRAYWMPADEKAKAGTQYVLHFERNLENNKVDDQYRVTFNNVEISDYRVSNNVMECDYKVKTASEATIEGFNITIDNPTVGKALPAYLKYAENSIESETILIPQKGARVNTSWTPSDEKVQEGTEYVLHFEMDLGTAKVDDQARLLINSVEVPGYKIADGKLTFDYKYKTPGEKKTEEKPVEAVKSGDVKSGDAKPAETTKSGDEKKEVEFKVAFNTNGGTEINSQIVKNGAVATKPADPTKKDNEFKGWYLDKDLKNAFDFKTAIKADTTLYAKWEEVKKEEAKTEEKVETITWASASKWALEELTKANNAGVIPTIFDKEDLTKNITRKEFAHVAVRLYEKVSGKKAEAVSKNPFKDTKDTEVLKAYKVGITKGISDTEFAPDTEITREQMATMMARALTEAGIDTTVDLTKVKEFSDDNLMHNWSRSAIYFMSNIEIIKGMGDNTFGVNGNATREQSIMISIRSVEKFAK